MAGKIKGVNVNGTVCQIDYESLANKPSIPSKVSDLENDLGFTTGGTLEFDNSPKKSSSNPVTSAGIYNAINQLKNTMQSKIDALQATISTMQSEITLLKRRVALLESGADEDGTNVGFDDGIMDLSGDGITFSDGTVDLNSPHIAYNDGIVDITTGGTGVTGAEISPDGTVALSGAGVTMDNGTLDIRSNSFDNGVLDI